MQWIKIPVENHPLFHAALPKDPRISTLQMFGGIAGLVNGNMFGALFARSVLVRLSPSDQQEALALDGAEKRLMKDAILLPETIMDEPAELKSWLRRAFDYTATLPPKKRKGGAVKPGKGAVAKPGKGAVAKPARMAAAKAAAKDVKSAPTKRLRAKSAPKVTKPLGR